MAVTSKSAQLTGASASGDADKPADASTASASADTSTDTSTADARAEKIAAGQCAAPDSDPTPHVGRPVPGTVICSAHTMRYHNDGTPRG